MVKVLKSIDGSVVKTFTLDRPQPVKHPIFMDYPVDGVFQIAGHGVKDGRQARRVTVKNYKELNRLLYNGNARMGAL
ncbi:MAG: hypothetical protein K6T29_06095 [Peptococcaceae bacterium]|nr:hypothetical protein [Peptococcaceae bacterium]